MVRENERYKVSIARASNSSPALETNRRGKERTLARSPNHRIATQMHGPERLGAPRPRLLPRRERRRKPAVWIDHRVLQEAVAVDTEG